MDVIREQVSYKDILDLKCKIKNGRATKTEQKKYALRDEIVYYLSQADEELLVRLYVSSNLRKNVLVH